MEQVKEQVHMEAKTNMGRAIVVTSVKAVSVRQRRLRTSEQHLH